GSRQEITESEPAVSEHDLADLDGDRPPEHGAFGDEGVELATFSTRIDARWQLREQCAIEASAGERRAELRGVHRHEVRAKARVDELARELRRVVSPDREDRIEARAGKGALSIRAHVGEKQIAEGDVPHRG